MFERSGLSSGPGGGLAAAGAEAGVGVAWLAGAADVLPGALPAAGLGEAFCWFCLACALARLAAEAMMLAVVGQVDGSEPDDAVGAGVDVGGGSEVMDGGIGIDEKAPGAAPGPTPDMPGPRPAAAEGIIGSGEAIWPTACGKAGADGGP